ncbi:MAG: NlpC/P60 family protein [Thermodesulfobacteriota bacterium]
MKRHLFIFLVSVWIGAAAVTAAVAQSLPHKDEAGDRWGGMQKTIENYLGRPYVWGACGMKSFDCSGFVWRIMTENGIFIKRTTARKLYMSLPAVSGDRNYAAGFLVFFNNMKHVGIVKDQSSFYHAQVSKGTNLSQFDPFWRPQVDGFRKMPM